MFSRRAILLFVAGFFDSGLVGKMNAFAKTYNRFAMAHAKGLFDVKLARELSREWRAIENSGEWPK